jgi:hypothetical protein
MMDLSGEVESDGARGIEHMHVFKERLRRDGKPAARGHYNAPAQQDVMAIVGGMLVTDSQQVRSPVISITCCACDAWPGHVLLRRHLANVHITVGVAAVSHRGHASSLRCGRKHAAHKRHGQGDGGWGGVSITWCRSDQAHLRCCPAGKPHLPISSFCNHEQPLLRLSRTAVSRIHLGSVAPGHLACKLTASEMSVLQGSCALLRTCKIT